MCLESASRALVACLEDMFFTYVSEEVASFLWQSQCSICCSSKPSSLQKCCRWTSSLWNTNRGSIRAPITTEQRPNERLMIYRDAAGLPISLWADFNVPQMKNWGDDFKDAVLTAFLYTCRSKTWWKKSRRVWTEWHREGLWANPFLQLKPIHAELLNQLQLIQNQSSY